MSIPNWLKETSAISFVISPFPLIIAKSMTLLNNLPAILGVPLALFAISNEPSSDILQFRSKDNLKIIRTNSSTL